MYEALYRLIKEQMPEDLPITFGNVKETEENCGIYFDGSSNTFDRTLEEIFVMEDTRMIINYYTFGQSKGLKYGRDIINSLKGLRGLYSEYTQGKYVIIQDVQLLGNINSNGKGKLNYIDAFSINYKISYIERMKK